jgi:hypothetical protein
MERLLEIGYMLLIVLRVLILGGIDEIIDGLQRRLAYFWQAKMAADPPKDRYLLVTLRITAQLAECLNALEKVNRRFWMGQGNSGRLEWRRQQLHCRRRTLEGVLETYTRLAATWSGLKKQSSFPYLPSCDTKSAGDQHKAEKGQARKLLLYGWLSLFVRNILRFRPRLPMGMVWRQADFRRRHGPLLQFIHINHNKDGEEDGALTTTDCQRFFHLHFCQYG